MLAIARETRSIDGKGSGPATAVLTAGAHRVIPPPPGVAQASLSERIATVVAFATLALLALLSLFVLSRRRQLTALRELVAQALILEARQRPLLSSAGSAATPDPPPTIHRARRRWQLGRRRRDELPIVLPALLAHEQPAVAAVHGGLPQAAPDATIYRTQRGPRRSVLVAAALALALVVTVVILHLLRAGPFASVTGAATPPATALRANVAPRHLSR